MLDFFSDHPFFGAIIAIIIVLVIAVGGVMFSKNARNILFNGNEQVFDTNWKYEWAIIQLGNGELIEGRVSSWRDFDESDCVQFTMNGITYLTHYTIVILCSEQP